MKDIEYYTSLKEKENLLAMAVAKALKRIVPDNEERIITLRQNLSNTNRSLSKEIPCLKNYESWLCNIDHILSITKNNIEKLKSLLKESHHNECSFREVLETVDSVKHNFDIIKTNGQRKCNELCSIEMNIKCTLDRLNVGNTSKYIDIELPVATKVGKVFESMRNEYSKFHQPAIEIKPVKPTVVVVTKVHQELMDQPDFKIKPFKPIIVGPFLHKWHPKDHQLFLKIYGKIKQKDKRLLILQQQLSHISIGEIISHDIKYSLFRKKSEEAKTLVTEWKTKKEEINRENSDISNQNIEINCKNSGSITQFKKQASNRTKIKQEIKQWRQNKNLEQIPKESLIESKKINQINIEKNKGKSNYTKEEREIIKKKLELYKSQKQCRNSNGNSRVDISSRTENKKHLQLLREKDIVFMQLRKNKINEICKKNCKTVMVKKPKINTAPDNYKQHTISSKCFLYTKRDEMNPPISVDFIPKKSIPQWRCS